MPSHQPDADVRVDVELELDGEAALAPAAVRELVETVIVDSGLEGHVDVGVQFVDEQEIAQLNAEHRGKAAPTDVLSFPIDGTEPLPGGLPRQLGDVVICEPYVRRQLEEGSNMAPGGDVTMEAALRRCLVHGLLHLLGEEHDDDAAAERMFAREQRLLGLDAEGSA